jgi:pyridoxal/pyridoxine/pyridoxamine kinase
MKKCRVLIDFILGDTGELMRVGRVIELTLDQLKRVQALSPNMVEVLGDVKKPRAKKED